MFLCIVDLLLLLAPTKKRSTVPSKKVKYFFRHFCILLINLLLIGPGAGCRENQFYSLPFGQPLASIYVCSICIM